MHIPDGLMDPLVIAVGWVIALSVIAFAVLKINKTVDEKTVPFMAILAAGIFVAQMLNFPIGGGTTGHLIGAALVTILLGPWAAIIVLTVILLIQGLLFGDGGITALGLNLLNMTVVATVTAWLVLRITPRRIEWLSIPLAAWASVFLAATVCGIELTLSYSLSEGIYGIIGAVSIPSMMASYALIGIGEAVITSGIVLYLSKVAPEMIKYSAKKKRATGA